jgi:hypothetical protein
MTRRNWRCSAPVDDELKEQIITKAIAPMR